MNNEEKKKTGVFLGLGAAAAAALYFLSGRQSPDKASLSGQVTDAETGDAIGGIEVIINGYSGVTTHDGSYLVRNIEPGVYDVAFQDPEGRYQTLTL